MELKAKHFNRLWVCYVLRSGYHNGARCNPLDPHGSIWECGWRNEVHYSMTDTAFEKWKKDQE